MKKPYTIVPDASTPSSRELADWLAKDGQLLVPLVELLEKGERAIDEVIDVMGRATVEAVLKMSAEQVAGPKEQGRRDADRELYWHGVQAGRVALKERQLRVAKPRPRAGESGEVEIPDLVDRLTLSGSRRDVYICIVTVGRFGARAQRGLQRTRGRLQGVHRPGTVHMAFMEPRRGRRCGRRGSWTPKRASGSWSSMRRGWSGSAVGGASLREGLAELFTVNRLGLPQSLRRCLTTTNIIDSSHAGVRQHTDRVSRWRNEEMAVRWAAVTFRETEKHYRRITGYEHLWMLNAHLDEEKDGVLAGMQKVG